MEDMVQAYLTILEAETTKIKNEIFNVGNKNESVLEIANIVKHASLVMTLFLKKHQQMIRALTIFRQKNRNDSMAAIAQINYLY